MSSVNTSVQSCNFILTEGERKGQRCDEKIFQEYKGEKYCHEHFVTISGSRLSKTKQEIDKAVNAVSELEEGVISYLEDNSDFSLDMNSSVKIINIPIGDGRIWKLTMGIENPIILQEDSTHKGK